MAGGAENAGPAVYRAMDVHYPGVLHVVGERCDQVWYREEPWTDHVRMLE